MLFTINKEETFSISEFKEIQANKELVKEELELVEKVIDHIKRNKDFYIRLGFTTTSILSYNTVVGYAAGVYGMDKAFNEIIGLIISFGKYGCLGLGLKKTIEEMLAGASFKQASTAGIQYWLCYLFIQFYPKLFDMIRL